MTHIILNILASIGAMAVAVFLLMLILCLGDRKPCCPKCEAYKGKG